VRPCVHRVFGPGLSLAAFPLPLCLQTSLHLMMHGSARVVAVFSSNGVNGGYSACCKLRSNHTLTAAGWCRKRRTRCG
jgi:hypothetical protein